MVIIYNNKVEVYNPSFPNIQTHCLLPFVQGTSVLKNNTRPWEGAEYSIEMGLYDIENTVKYHTPFVWNHIKISSLEINKDIEPREGGIVFNAEISIYPQLCGCKSVFKHTFIVKNGVFFFLDSILKTINSLLDRGFSAEDINFAFLDEQCICFNFRAANHQPKPCFELSSECTPGGFYSLINNMEIIVYNNGVGKRTGDVVWEEVDIVLETTNAYVISVVDKILSTPNTHFAPHTEGKKTTFSFHTNDSYNGSYCGRYVKHLANTETHENLKKLYMQKLIVDGLPLINKEKAIEYLSTTKG